MHVILCTAEDGTYSVYGPFISEKRAENIQRFIESKASLDTQVIPMTQFNESDFSIYSE
jgi:hypothetical protein